MKNSSTGGDVMSQANTKQIGGQHYTKHGDLQPWDMFFRWNLNPFQAAILKYVVRYRDKDGIQDLEKAKHYLDKLIEEEQRVLNAATHEDALMVPGT